MKDFEAKTVSEPKVLRLFYTPLKKEPNQDRDEQEEKTGPGKDGSGLDESTETPIDHRAEFIEQNRKQHIAELQKGIANWHSGSGELDHVKVRVSALGREWILFLLIDSGSPKSLLNVEAIQASAECDNSYFDLVNLIRSAAHEVPKLTNETGVEITQAIGLEITWAEPLYKPESPVDEEGGWVLEPFGILDRLEGLNAHGILGRDFKARFAGQYEPAEESANSIITIVPYPGRTISSSCTEPSRAELRNPRGLKYKTTGLSDSPPGRDPGRIASSVITIGPIQTGGSLRVSRRSMSQDNQFWTCFSRTLQENRTGMLTERPVLSWDPPKLKNSGWTQSVTKQVYTCGLSKISPQELCLVPTDLVMNKETEEEAITVLKLIQGFHPPDTLARSRKSERLWINNAFWVDQPGLLRLFVAVINPGASEKQVWQTKVGEVMIWQPPLRDDWRKDVSDHEIMCQLREEPGALSIRPPEVRQVTKRNRIKDRPPTPFARSRETQVPKNDPQGELTPDETDSEEDDNWESLEIDEDQISTASESEQESDDDSSPSADTTHSRSSWGDEKLSVAFRSTTRSFKFKQARKRRRPDSRVFLSAVRAFQTPWRKKALPVATTEMLPHIRFPIGERKLGSSWKNNPMIRGLLDTGSGVSIGSLPYFRDIALRYKELVKEFGKLDSEDHDELTVGGIDKQGQGTACTHFIILKTPFMDKGQEVEVRIALTNGLSCNLIFGMPFIVKSKMVINPWEKYAFSPVFQANFPLQYHPPELREATVAQDGSVPALLLKE